MASSKLTPAQRRVLQEAIDQGSEYVICSEAMLQRLWEKGAVMATGKIYYRLAQALLAEK